MPMSGRLLRPRQTGFNPRSISGLALWLDAADTSQVTVDAGVSVWRDKSGNGRNATQAVGGKQPIYTNTIKGRRVVTFQGTDDTMSVANAAAFNATSQSIFVVARQTSAANQALFYKASGAAVNGVLMRYRAGTEFWLYQQNDGSAQTISNQANTNTNTNVYTIILQPTSQNGWVNGTLPANGSASATLSYDDTGPIWIGSRRDIGEYFIGDVCEILHWPSALASTQRQSVERYLGRKWGITVA